MKQLLILSGKGGTGKTTIASSFIKLSNANAYADCDVDAPNLHLVLEQFDAPKTEDFFGMDKAYIDPIYCTGCSKCLKNCRFGAISDMFVVDPLACEGCSVCVATCETGAAQLKRYRSGDLYLYKSDDHVFSTAKLKMGSGTSGMLVTDVKNNLKNNVASDDIAIIDGSPGIGCPVIASLSGVDMVLMVAEPSLSGMHDLQRIVKTADNFRVPMALCINKYDSNIEISSKIEEFCREKGINYLGKIPYDKDVIRCLGEGKSAVESDSKASDAIKCIFNEAMNIFKREGNSKEINKERIK